MATPDELDRIYREGVAAVRRGDTAAARAMLLAVTAANPFHEQAWLWLGGVAETDEERIVCLENVLALNPDHERARRALAALRPAAAPEPPAVEPSPPALTHGPAPAVGAELNALVSGEKRPPPPGPDLRRGEEWRAALFDAAYVPSSATLVHPREPEPPTTFAEMVRVWGDLLILYRAGGLEREIARGGALHAAASIGAAALLRLVGSLFLLIVLGVLAGPRWQPPLMRSLDELGARTERLGQLETEAVGTLLGALDVLGVDPVLPSEVLDSAARGARMTGRQAAQSAGRLVLLFLVGVLPGMLLAQMLSAVFVNLVSVGMLNGRGTYGRTLHGLALALVVGEIVQLPAVLLTPFLPVALLLTLYGALAVYRWVLAGAALDAAQGIGLLGGMGGVAMGGILGGVFAGLCGALVNGLI